MENERNGRMEKTGSLACPLCGGEVVQTKLNMGAKITTSRNPGSEAEWNCIKCGSRFYAEMQGSDVDFKGIDTEQQFGCGVNILGNAKSKW